MTNADLQEILSLIRKLDRKLCCVATESNLAIQFQDEGIALGTAGTVTEIDVVGTRITATRVDDKVTFTVNTEPRVVGTTSSATPTPNADTTDIYHLTALAVDAAFVTPTGTPVNGQKLIIRILDNGVSRNITWSADYVAGGIPLPSATTAGKIMHCGFMYNTDNGLNKWQLIAFVSEQ